jgi:hypothetical protein
MAISRNAPRHSPSTYRFGSLREASIPLNRPRRSASCFARYVDGSKGEGKMRTLVGAIWLLMFAPAFAQDGKASVDCFSVIAPGGGAGAPNYLKLNRCSGESWLLVRVMLPKPKPSDKGDPYTYRWFSIGHEDGREAVMVQPLAGIIQGPN